MSSDTGETRTEHDSMGEIEVPRDALWRAQTQRAVENFPISGTGLESAQIVALARIKRAAALVNGRLGILDDSVAQAIATAADSVIAGEHHEHFPVDVYQTGSGTSTNMNANEVIATRANEIATGKRGGKEPVHPNDHVNMEQSSNDVIPTAMHVSAAIAIKETLIPALQHLSEALGRKATELDNVVKIGRTHLMDAVPLTLGQEFSGYVDQLDHDIRRIEMVLPDVYELAIGGTTVGTGLNAHPEFAERVRA